jgi:hypothetical protein
LKALLLEFIKMHQMRLKGIVIIVITWVVSKNAIYFLTVRKYYRLIHLRCLN